MTKFKKLVLALLALVAITFPQAAFAGGGKSNTPNPIDEHADFLFDFISAPSGYHYILEEAHDQFKAFASWCYTSSNCDFNLFLTKVRTGASHTVAAGSGADAGDSIATWTGTFGTFPVGNVRANAYPIVPCPKPAWVPAGVNVICNGGNPAGSSDTALVATSSNWYTSKVVIAEKYWVPVEVEETERTSSESPLKKSGRIFVINPHIWPELTLEQQYAWVARAVLIALGTPLTSRVTTDFSFLKPTGPDVQAAGAYLGMTSLDTLALDAAHACYTPSYQYTSSPACSVPVP